VYVALFNYDEKLPQTITIPLDRIDKALATAPLVSITDISSGVTLKSAHDSVSVELSPSESKLIELHWKQRPE
jgi:alpha-galactosidase